MVRNPLAVLASWHSLDHPIRQGHAPMAEALDPALAQRLAAVDGARPRRLALLDWYFQRFLKVLGPKRILLYEEIIASDGACLAGLAPQARQLPKLLDAPLENRNDNALYGAAAQAREDAQTLLATPNHACWRLYEKAEVAALLEALRSRSAQAAAPPPHEPPAQREPSPPLERRGSSPAASPSRPLASGEPSGAYQPKLSFVIVGAQKCGTTALAEYLRQHPQIGMPLEEGHVFDAPDFSPNWSPQEIDERYAPRFEHCRQAEVFGESTPFYLFLPEAAAALRRYNPNLKLIVLLRDRVERAISHYYMERNRGNENAPLWLALLAEPLRTGRPAAPDGLDLALRRYSYHSRGLYSRQILNLQQHFPSNQVHFIRTPDLRSDHQFVLRRLFAFLGVAEDVAMQHRIVQAGNYPQDHHRLVSWMLRLSYLREAKRMKLLSQQLDGPSAKVLQSFGHKPPNDPVAAGALVRSPARGLWCKTTNSSTNRSSASAQPASAPSSSSRTPTISIVISAYKMQREAPRTLLSFLPPLQKCTKGINYEIIIVDNGSPKPLMLDDIISSAKRPVRLVRVEPKEARVSPVNAINTAVRDHAAGDFIMVCIDGARLASSHLVCRTASILARHPNAFIYVGSRHLGRKLQMQSVQEGYDQTMEDAMLNSVAWDCDLDQLYPISVWAGSHKNGDPLLQNESNAFTLSREMWNLEGGYNEKFTSPGGGLCNLELFGRLACKTDALNVLLLGEATFHQVHGGIATSNDSFFNDALDEYFHVTGREYAHPLYQFFADLGEHHNRMHKLKRFLFSKTSDAA